MSSPDDVIAALERRIDALESQQQIEALHGDYIRALADQDVAGLAAAYADEAQARLRGRPMLRGKQEIESALAGMMQGPDKPRSGFVLSSPEITVAGDRARGTWTWHKLFCEFPTATGMLRVWGPWLEGRYRCEYVREDGRWKFLKLQFRVVAPDPDPLPASEE